MKKKITDSTLWDLRKNLEVDIKGGFLWILNAIKRSFEKRSKHFHSLSGASVRIFLTTRKVVSQGSNDC